MSENFISFPASFEDGRAILDMDGRKDFNTVDSALKSAKKDSRNHRLVMVFSAMGVHIEVLPHAYRVLSYNDQLYIPLTLEEQEALDE